MKEIIDIVSAFDKAQTEGKQTALATVVHVEGSSYRKDGARMLITEDGELTGAISGGCLEGDALHKALFVMHEKKAKLVVYDTSDEDDIEIGFQLGCNGIIQVLIEPIDTTQPNNPINLLKEALNTRENAILITLFSLDRSVSQKGTSLLLKNDGTILETLNDRSLVDSLAADAKETFINHKSLIRKYIYDGKELTAFINIIKPQITLVVVGAGNDAMPLVKIGELIGWRVMVVDGRPDYANRKRFSSGCQVIVSRPGEILSAIDINDQTMFVLMTHNYNYDLALLRELVLRKVSYIGILGSSGKFIRMMGDLKNEGLNIENELSKIYSPVGLDIGAETPEEIALSIVVEIQTVLSGRKGKHLRRFESHSRTSEEG
jgi:xanthine/CO dehydrogenase XdhC/CoxF family maturation factor